MAPEVLLKNKYSEKADVYSFGILLWEIVSGNRPYDQGTFRTMNQAQLMLCILEQHSRPSLDGFDSSLEQLIKDCWNSDPRIRPSFSEIIVRLRRIKMEYSNKNYKHSSHSSVSSFPTDDSKFLSGDSEIDYLTKSTTGSIN